MLFKNCITENGVCDIAVKNGVITNGEYDGEVIDCNGLFACYGFLDMHCHLRDPGFTYKEDITSGLKAAAKGGFTSVMPMPNTKPVCDSPDVVNYILQKSKPLGVKVYPVAAATEGQKGEHLTDFEALKESGAIAFSDDGVPVCSNSLAKEAIIKAANISSFFISHCETPELNQNGKVTPESEEAMILRECEISKETGKRVHIAHVSTAKGIEIIRKAKKSGACVTAESCPHYFCFNETEVSGTNFKMNPPLRTENDRLAVIEGLKDRTLDVISTDHAPHTPEEKAAPYNKAPNGILGFETAFAAGYTHLVKTGRLTLSELVYKMSKKPYEICGIKGGELKEGMPADMVFINLSESFVYKKEEILSKSQNSPFIDKELYGRIKITVSNGNIIYDERK